MVLTIEVRSNRGDLFPLSGFGLASFLSASGRGPLFSSRKRHFQKCQVWYNPKVSAKTYDKIKPFNQIQWTFTF